MAYFDKVYLKRVNKYGTNIQERIQNKKIHDFSIVLNKSPNKVTIFKDSETYDGILQNKTNSEKEVVDYLLTYKNIRWSDGTILTTEEVVDLKRKKWLIFHLDEYVSIGYNRYQIIELDRDIQWIDDGIIYSEYVHFTGSGANLRDKSITSKFSIQYDVSVMYLPNKILNLVMKTNPKMKKGIRILIGNEVWKVSGIDKISVPGVSYVTLEEDYIDEQDDVEIANGSKLADWSIQSSIGDTISLVKGDSAQVNFILYYNDIIREEPYKVTVKDRIIATYSKGEFTGLADGETICKVSLINSPEIEKTFTIKVSDTQEESFTIIGPERVKVEATFEFTIVGDKEGVSFESQSGNFIIESIEENIITIRGCNIGKDKIIAKKDSAILFEKNVNVESIWMEG
jgi:hypothetical protein